MRYQYIMPVAIIENVLLTPHTATSMEAMRRAFPQITDNLYRALSGEKPWYLVNDVWE